MKNGTLVEKFFYKDTGKEIKINGKNKKIIQKIDLKGKNINTVTGNYTNVGLYVKGDSEVVSGKKFKYKGDTILWTKVKKTWKETNKSHPFSDLITLLNSHPEGVYLHYKNGSSEHGIVITRYEKKKDGG